MIKRLLTSVIIAAVCVGSLASCGTFISAADGTKFRTYANGKSLKMRAPNGLSLEMEDYDHATSILATGQAIKDGSEPIVSIAKGYFWSRAIQAGLEGLKSVTNTKSDNDLKALENNNKTTTDGKLIDAQGEAYSEGLGAGAEPTVGTAVPPGG